VNEQTLGIIMGIVFTIVVASVSIALMFLFIYYFQPEFIGELYPKNCSFQDLMLLRP
jgi:hypothetical protein